MQGGEALSAIGALDYSKEERKRLAKLYVGPPVERYAFIRTDEKITRVGMPTMRENEGSDTGTRPRLEC
jgi:hypothetical protein